MRRYMFTPNHFSNFCFNFIRSLMLIPSSMRYIQKNIHVNIYVAVNLMIGGPDILGTG